MTSLFHYTTLEAFIGILQSDYVCFWGSRYDSMNDPNDYVFAKNIVLPIAKDWLEHNHGIEEYDEEEEDVEIYPYVVSFSERGDDLNLWRLYHGEICIEVDKNILERECGLNGRQFSKCCYSSDNYTEISDAINIVKNIVNIKDDRPLDFLREVSAFIKNKDFEIESEWRVIDCDFPCLGVKKCSSTNEIIYYSEEEMPKDIGIKGIKNGDIILYKKFKFSKNIIKRIIIFENDEKKFKRLQHHLWLILKDRNYPLTKSSIVQTKKFFRK